MKKMKTRSPAPRQHQLRCRKALPQDRRLHESGRQRLGACQDQQAPRLKPLLQSLGRLQGRLHRVFASHSRYPSPRRWRRSGPWRRLIFVRHLLQGRAHLPCMPCNRSRRLRRGTREWRLVTYPRLVAASTPGSKRSGKGLPRASTNWRCRSVARVRLHSLLPQHSRERRPCNQVARARVTYLLCRGSERTVSGPILCSIRRHRISGAPLLQTAPRLQTWMLR